MDQRKTALIFKAFCDENRVRILNLLRGGEKCACRLLEELSISQPTLSHHMKILVECNGKLDMVICKNKQDAIRMYNMIEEWCERDKMKYIGFMGDLSYSRYKSDWITKIQKLTNWTRKKITRMSTRP